MARKMPTDVSVEKAEPIVEAGIRKRGRPAGPRSAAGEPYTNIGAYMRDHRALWAYQQARKARNEGPAENDAVTSAVATCKQRWPNDRCSRSVVKRAIRQFMPKDSSVSYIVELREFADDRTPFPAGMEEIAVKIGKRPKVKKNSGTIRFGKG